ncbi:uncharacterized protein LOC127123278 [Lathyrus oleraceus]|uniref:uncharacterized protein LOC127123278 n=1 Tax=Pisum sativum TaxID=3888 RepID=UPI0021D13096|nr:uncharacterized protein LOC127123278 [Pisum sativum]
MADCWGVLKDLKLTESLGLRKVEVNVDSELVLRAIQGESRNIPSCCALIIEITRLIKNHKLLIISHTFREANACVDALAKMGSMDKDSKSYTEIPGALVLLLEATKLISMIRS